GHLRIHFPLCEVSAERRESWLLRQSSGRRADRPGAPRTRPEYAQTALCRNSAHPGRGVALYQSLVPGQCAGAFEESEGSDTESIRELRLSKNSGTSRQPIRPTTNLRVLPSNQREDSFHR